LLLLLLVVLLAMLLAISSPAKAGGISRRLINKSLNFIQLPNRHGDDSESLPFWLKINLKPCIAERRSLLTNRERND